MDDDATYDPPASDVLDTLDLAPVKLPPDLAAFAEEAIKAGRYKDIGEAVEEGLRLLRRHEAQVLAFQQSIDDAVAEADRDGWVTLEEALEGVDRIIETLPE